MRLNVLAGSAMRRRSSPCKLYCKLYCIISQRFEWECAEGKAGGIRFQSAFLNKFLTTRRDDKPVLFYFTVRATLR